MKNSIFLGSLLFGSVICNSCIPSSKCQAYAVEDTADTTLTTQQNTLNLALQDTVCTLDPTIVETK